MSIAKLASFIGKAGLMRLPEFGGIQVPVTITDVKEAFGRTDVLVTPIAGEGVVWVSLDRVTLDG